MYTEIRKSLAGKRFGVWSIVLAVDLEGGDPWILKI
jgi:hypothetical protein